MRPPNKSRSRNKNNRRNNNSGGGNVLNRVYDSAGPDGRVRGTPVQVIEKYQALAHDNSLAGDRVAMENFQQHAEHYIRLINEAQRQIAERREQMESQNQNQNQNRNAGDDNSGNSGQNKAQANNNSSNRPQQNDAPKPDLSQTEQPDISAPKPSGGEVAAKVDAAIQPSDMPNNDSGGLVETPEGGPVEAKPEKPKRQRRPKRVANKEPAEEVRPSE